jgi:DNA-binding NarL/FixJ family response regulator
MSIVLLSNDLLIASHVTGAGLRNAAAIQTCGEPEAAVEACRAQRVALLLVDLTLAGLDVADLIVRLRSLELPPDHVLAFGPHVHKPRLLAARQAGCDQVLSRGDLHARIDQIIREATKRRAPSVKNE